MMKQELIHSHIIVAMFCGWEPKKPTKDDPNGYLALLEDNEIHRVVREWFSHRKQSL